eukprot:3717323-Ditylum_brightwellii.AAC.1
MQAKLDQITAMLSDLQHHSSGLAAYDPIGVLTPATIATAQVLALMQRAQGRSKKNSTSPSKSIIVGHMEQYQAITS